MLCCVCVFRLSSSSVLTAQCCLSIVHSSLHLLFSLKFILFTVISNSGKFSLISTNQLNLYQKMTRFKQIFLWRNLYLYRHEKEETIKITKKINVRENQGSNQECTIQKTGNIGYTRHRTKTNKTTNTTEKIKKYIATRSPPQTGNEA